MIIEIAAFTPLSAITASRAGAGRIELCSGYSEGGLSPSAASITIVRKSVKTPLHVMIRPRIGDFIYSEHEKEIILADIEFCRKARAEGIVFGALLYNGSIDKEFTQKVVTFAKPLSVTFHRAFDLCTDLRESLNDLIECGVARVLTSGGKSNAPEGAEIIASLVQHAGDKIIVLPGGGLTPENITSFIKKTSVQEVHFSAKQITKSTLQNTPKITLTSEGEVNDQQWYTCDPEKVISMTKKIKMVTCSDES